MKKQLTNNSRSEFNHVKMLLLKLFFFSLSLPISRINSFIEFRFLLLSLPSLYINIREKYNSGIWDSGIRIEWDSFSARMNEWIVILLWSIFFLVSEFQVLYSTFTISEFYIHIQCRHSIYTLILSVCVCECGYDIGNNQTNKQTNKKKVNYYRKPKSHSFHSYC